MTQTRPRIRRKTKPTPEPARSDAAVRFSWMVRLMVTGWRARRLAAVVGCCAFAVATLALFAGLLTWALRAHIRPSTAGTAVTGAMGVLAERVELVAFLREDLPASARDTLSAVLGRLPGVDGVRLLGSDEALARMRSELGDRASVLEGVEEGFLPATLEVTLQSGADGSARADALAWRLRRMEGITDVDVLRSTEDERIARAEAASRRMGGVGLGLAALTFMVAVGLGGLVLRRRRADAVLLTGLGFTGAAIAAPGALMGALCGLTGAATATTAAALAAQWVSLEWTGGVSLATRLLTATGGGTRWVLAAVIIVVTSGAGMGWWGARLSGDQVDELATRG